MFKVRVTGKNGEQDFLLEAPILHMMGTLSHMAQGSDCMETDQNYPLLAGVPIEPKCFSSLLHLLMNLEGAAVESSTMSIVQLCELVNACDFLDCQPILDICGDHLCKIFKSTDVETIREMFGLEDDFSPEEKEQIHKEQRLFTHNTINVKSK